MALWLAGLWAAVACTGLHPEAGVMVVAAAQPGSAMRLSLNCECQPTKRSGHVAGRINKGHQAARDQFRYAAYVENFDDRLACGGALINKQWVLTAAHCVYNATKVNVTLGASDLSDPGENWHQTMQVDKIIPVPRYRRKTERHDIALVHLPQPANIGEHIQTIPVARKAQPTNGEVNGTVAGWGYLSDTEAHLSKQLKFLKAKTISKTVCRKRYPSELEDFILCVRGIDGVTCSGDSGSAFVTSDGIVRGLLAAGAFGCGTEDAEVFTDVHMYWHWIKNTINGNGTEVSTTEQPAG